MLAFGAGSLVTGCKDPEGEDGQAGLTDCDSGANADAAGQGRTGGNIGISDSDGGANADPDEGGDREATARRLGVSAAALEALLKQAEG